MEPGSYSFLISNLDAFGMIYTQLFALITSRLVILLWPQVL